MRAIYGDDPGAGQEAALVMTASAFVMFLNAAHLPIMAIPAIGFLVATSPYISARTKPLLWMLAGAGWLVVAVAFWHRMEDHVYLGAYWLTAIGTSLARGADFWPTLRTQARLLVGLTFAVGVLWKVTSPDFLSGRTFTMLLSLDDRFSPISQIAGWDRHAGRAALERAADLPGLTVDFDGPPIWLLGLLVAWTLVLEIAIAVSFLMSDESRVARARTPTLLLFSWTTYLLVPVVGFAALFMTMGAVVARPGSRDRQLCAASVILLVVIPLGIAIARA